MAALGRVLTFTTNPATQFTAVIAQNAGAGLSLAVPDLGKLGRGRVLRVSLATVENKAWEVYFFGTAARNDASPVLNEYLGRVAFTAGDGFQIAGAGLFLYSAACDIPVRDDSQQTAIHLVLVNRSTATLGGANQIRLELGVDPTFGGG